MLTALVLAYVAVPIVTLVLGSLHVDGAWSLANYRALTTSGQEQALLVPVTDALVVSLRTAVDATWMSLSMGLLVAVVVTRRSRSRAERRIRGGLDALFMLPLGVSAVTLGFGFLITLDQPPLDLRDSPLLVPIAQALVALPLVVRTIVPVLSGIDDRQRQAAASLGASPLRAMLTVDLPVVWKPLLAASGFAFAVSLGEFGATSFLARDDAPTLPVVIFRLLGHPGDLNYGMALAASVVLAATTALVDARGRTASRPVPGGDLMLGLRDVSVSYDGKPAVVDVSLDLADGQVLAVLGPSGCGKSTLLRAVAGLEPVTTGSVSWDGADLAGVPTHKRGFALMFQDGQLFAHLTVARNVGYALRLRRERGHRHPGGRAARARRPPGVRRPAARHPVRWRAATGGTGPVAGGAAPAAPAGRAAVRPRRRPAQAAGSRAARHPPRGRHHRPDGHPRPRGGVHGRRPDRGDAGRSGRAAGADRRRLAAARRPGHGALPRLRRVCSTVRRRRTCSPRPGSKPPRRWRSAGPPWWSSRTERCSGTVRSSRITPEQVRLEVDVDGVGSMDAVAPLDVHPGPGDVVRLTVDATRLAAVGGA